MLNWGDKEAAEGLAFQLHDVLRDRTMTFDQLASVYSIKHGRSVTDKLKEMSRNGRPVALGDFIAQMEDLFEAVGRNQVRARARPVPARTVAAAGCRGTPTASGEEATAEAPVVMKYADVSRGVQGILKERQGPVSITELDAVFEQRFKTSVSDIVGMATDEYLQRKENIFDYDPVQCTVALHSASTSGPPAADPNAIRDETFVVKEFEQLIEAMGPVVYISTLCGKFIQRNGVSVTSVINARPLDVFKKRPDVFLIVGQGNVTLKKYEHLPDVQRLMGKPTSKASRIAKAADEASMPIPEVVTEEHVVQEFRRLILADSTDSVYISSLCGRFLQRFKQPVTAIIDCKPADFLRKYPDTFVMTGGGNVGLREILGPDAVSVPPPPPRLPKALREASMIPADVIEGIQLTDEVYSDIVIGLHRDMGPDAVSQRVAQACKLIEQASFLALDELVVGGAAGKGLAGFGVAGEIVLFVKQLPFRNFPQWLPHILDTLAPVLESQLKTIRAERFKVENDHLRFFLLAGHGGLTSDLLVQLYVSPVYRGREHLLESIRASAPEQRQYFYPAFVRERNDFVARRSRRVRDVMALVAWWAGKQGWSSSAVAPPGWLMELAVAHSCRGMALEKSGDDAARFDGLAEAVSRTMETLAGLVSARVTWSEGEFAHYAPEDVPEVLLEQTPLFMDVVNPYCNLLGAGGFNSQELVSAAQPPECFFAFKREAAKWLVRADAMTEGDEEYADAEEGSETSG